MITLLDVSQRPFRPVTVILEDGGLESVEWLVERAEKILTNLVDADVKVRVKVLVVGDMEIKRENWRDRNINHYRLLGDPWFITTLQAPNFPAGEIVSQTIVYTSPLQHSIILYPFAVDWILLEISTMVTVLSSSQILLIRTWSDVNGAPRHQNGARQILASVWKESVPT